MKNGTVAKQSVIITAIYLVVSAVYIIYSYRIVHSIIHEPDLIKTFITYKGIILVILTSLIVFFLVRRILQRQHRITILYRDSNEYFRKIFENAPTGIAIADWDGVFDQCNPAFCNMLGYTEEEIRSLNFRDLLYHEDKELNLQETELLKSGQKPNFELESRYIHKSGKPVWSHKFVTLLPGKDEGPAKVLALVTDISERKVAEKEKSIKEYYLRKSQEIASIGTWHLDLTQNRLTWTEQTYVLFGLPVDSDVNYEIFLDHIHPEDRDYVDQKWKEALKSGNYEIEHRILVNGNVKWVREKSDFVFDCDGNIQQAIGVVQDISDRKHNEQILKEQKLLFETMFNAITDGVVITSPKREIIMANRGMTATFGYSPDELIGNTTEILYEDSEKYRSAGETFYKANAKAEGDFYLTYYKNKKNKVFPGETFGTKLHDSNGDWIGNLGIMRDVSERIAFIEDLKQSNEELLKTDLALRAKNVELYVTNRKLIKSEAEHRRSSLFFEQLFLQSATSTQLLDAKGWCVKINPKLAELFGVKPEDIEGKKYNILEDGEIIRTGVADKLKRVFDNKETVSSEVEFDIEYASKSTGVEVTDPKKKWFFVKAYPILDDEGNLENVIVQHEEITERIQMEQKIVNTIIQTEELERKRIAQELHDGIGPLLSAAKLYFQTYVSTDKQQLKEAIKNQMVDTLNDTIGQISLVSNNLSPHVLNDFGLKAAVQRLLDKLKPVSEIVCSFDYNLEREIKKEYEITLYRVVTELINNTLKHARATKIEILIEDRSDDIRMVFRNDGAAFDFDQVKMEGRGMGLFNIMSRVNSLGGKVDFKSGQIKGIEYQVTLRV